MFGLTPAQKALFDIIARHVRETGRVPSGRALAREYSAVGKNGGHPGCMIADLEERGWITREPGPRRSIRIAPPAFRFAGLAAMGDIALVPCRVGGSVIMRAPRTFADRERDIAYLRARRALRPPQREAIHDAGRALLGPAQAIGYTYIGVALALLTFGWPGT